MGILPSRHYSRICSFQTFKKATTPNYFLVNILYVKASYTSRKKESYLRGFFFFAKKLTYAMGLDCGVSWLYGRREKLFVIHKTIEENFIVH